MLSKIDSKEGSDSSSTPPTLLAWCSHKNNSISIIDLETKQDYATFDGASIRDADDIWNHVKEIPNTKLLVSLHHDYYKCANMEIFDISKKGKANKIYSLGEFSGSKLGVGYGDVTHNSRRNILAAIPVSEEIAYHLFNVNAYASNTKEIVKLNRKTRWSPYYSDEEANFIAGFDFNPAGDSIATIDHYGVCLISDVNTNNYGLHLQVGSEPDPLGRCRWSTNTGEPLLFVKYDCNILNILDVEKKALILSNPIQLEKSGTTCCIDICQSNGNLLASGGTDNAIKIFDKRESKIVKTFEGVHSGLINCVRWNPSGDMIASASHDKTAKLLDFKTGKVLHTGTTSDGKRGIKRTVYIQEQFGGEWVENKISGLGIYTWLDGRKYEGGWLSNNMHGTGIYTWKMAENMTVSTIRTRNTARGRTNRYLGRWQKNFTGWMKEYKMETLAFSFH